MQPASLSIQLVSYSPLSASFGSSLSAGDRLPFGLFSPTAPSLISRPSGSPSLAVILWQFPPLGFAVLVVHQGASLPLTPSVSGGDWACWREQ